MRIDRSVIGLLALVLFVGCRKDRPERPTTPPIDVGSSGGVYITNEGNFGWGNASVSYYDLTTGAAAEDLFQPANGVALGDVCQSMRLFNGKGYLVMNNSNRVVVVDPQSFVVSATITGFNSPRYLLPVSNGKAYVTDLYAGAIAILDLATNSITGSVPCPGSTEELALAYGKAFVTNQSRPYVYVIDSATDQLVDSIAVGSPNGSIVEDAHGKLWVLSSGYLGQGITPALHRIDPATRTVEQSFSFPTGASPWRLTIDGTRTVLHFLNNGVCRMPIDASALPADPFIPANGRNFYGLGVHPISNEVYVADAIDYVQRGMVYRYTAGGSELTSFQAGIIPGGFCFQ